MRAWLWRLRVAMRDGRISRQRRVLQALAARASVRDGWWRRNPARTIMSWFSVAARPFVHVDAVIVGDDQVRAALADPRVRAPYDQSTRGLGLRFALTEVDAERHHEARERLAVAMSSPGGRLYDEAMRRAVRVAERAVVGGNGHLDLIGELLIPAASEFTVHWLGIGGKGFGPDLNNAIYQWTQSIFTHVFLNPKLPGAKRSALLEEMADDHCAAFRQHLRDLLTNHEIRPESAAECLSRGNVDRWLDDVIGMASGSIPNLVWAGSNVVDELLRQPKFLRTWCPESAGAVEPVVRESLRLQPTAPALNRRTLVDVTIPLRAPRHGRVVRHGNVVVVTSSAELDSCSHLNSLRFEPSRAPVAEQLLTFGSGMHRCIAAQFAPSVLANMLFPLFACGGLRRGRVAGMPVADPLLWSGRVAVRRPDVPGRFVVNYSVGRAK